MKKGQKIGLYHWSSIHWKIKDTRVLLLKNNFELGILELHGIMKAYIFSKVTLYCGLY